MFLRFVDWGNYMGKCLVLFEFTFPGFNVIILNCSVKTYSSISCIVSVCAECSHLSIPKSLE